MDLKSVKGHNALHAVTEYYAQCLAEAAQREEQLMQLLAQKDKELEILRATFTNGRMPDPPQPTRRETEASNGAS